MKVGFAISSFSSGITKIGGCESEDTTGCKLGILYSSSDNYFVQYSLIELYVILIIDKLTLYKLGESDCSSESTSHHTPSLCYYG